MRRDYALAGFVMTGEEWDALDELARAQLLSAVLRRDGAWGMPMFPRGAEREAVPEPIDDVGEPYAHYELVLVAA